VSLRPYLQLVRLPAVFTAMADVFLGFLLTHASLAPVGTFVLLLVASSSLYLAGMALNDVFDRERDAVERPGRPIPSGRVTVRAAVILASVLMLVGVGAAAVVGVMSLLIAVGLVGCILLYDGPLKGTPLGPVVMGGCRFLNVMLAASAVPAPWQPPQLWIAGAMGLYVVGVTWFARNEAGTSSRFDLIGSAVVVNLGFAGVVATVLLHDWPHADRIDPSTVLLLFAVVALTIDRRLFAAIASPTPGRVQNAVRTMLLTIIVIDATLVVVATASVPLGLATAALLVPALVLGRFIWVT
jgi:hypothetical protein